ncbi:MAG: bifunctional folylpolyglutamate synthase/dihydrofolate synthase [Vicinamibacteria bacterium]|jgi:dihydrofolate synthase/folylpolyglutamate synthase|nr:bifunctional folylpolyglutamate synthase/dihydrofolate synthase [Vicinamibacteria bacterium]
MEHHAEIPSTPGRAFLASCFGLGVKFGLETTRALAAALGHPERSAPALLVAGTNGKGSVVAYVDAMLRAGGLRVGRYTSPHLVRLNERIVVAGDEIRDDDLEAALLEVAAAVKRLQSEQALPQHPTFFETLTAAAFCYFRKCRVDAMVLEVGMGARLDATNIVDPCASAIVTIALDHEAFLGTTLAAIAGEKAGVLRAGCTTVLGRLPAEAREEIEMRARAMAARLVDLEDCAVASSSSGLTLATPRHHYAGLTPLAGAHQIDNLLVALRLAEESRLMPQGLELETVVAGVNRTAWPGRIERIPGQPNLILDGAHNPAGAQALAVYLRTLPSYVLLFGMMRDKDARGVAAALFPGARRIVLTRPPIARAACAAEIVATTAPLADRADRDDDPARALSLAESLAQDGESVVVAGSLYLVGEIHRLLAERRGPSRAR